MSTMSVLRLSQLKRFTKFEIENEEISCNFKIDKKVYFKIQFLLLCLYFIIFYIFEYFLYLNILYIFCI